MLIYILNKKCQEYNFYFAYYLGIINHVIGVYIVILSVFRVTRSQERSKMSEKDKKGLEKK